MGNNGWNQMDQGLKKGSWCGIKVAAVAAGTHVGDFSLCQVSQSTKLTPRSRLLQGLWVQVPANSIPPQTFLTKNERHAHPGAIVTLAGKGRLGGVTLEEAPQRTPALRMVQMIHHMACFPPTQLRLGAQPAGGGLEQS